MAEILQFKKKPKGENMMLMLPKGVCQSSKEISDILKDYTVDTFIEIIECTSYEKTSTGMDIAVFNFVAEYNHIYILVDEKKVITTFCYKGDKDE